MTGPRDQLLTPAGAEVYRAERCEQCGRSFPAFEDRVDAADMVLCEPCRAARFKAEHPIGVGARYPASHPG